VLRSKSFNPRNLLRLAGHSWREICTQTGLSKGTAQRAYTVICVFQTVPPESVEFRPFTRSRLVSGHPGKVVDTKRKLVPNGPRRAGFPRQLHMALATAPKGRGHYSLANVRHGCFSNEPLSRNSDFEATPDPELSCAQAHLQNPTCQVKRYISPGGWK
jgi:hypothetical protein